MFLYFRISNYFITSRFRLYITADTQVPLLVSVKYRLIEK
jgi:hypothetical protein